MARRRKRSRAVGTHRRRVVRRRRRVAVANPHFARRHRRRNPGLRRRHHYRRNPGVFSGVALNVAGVIGGAAITKLVTDQLPTSYQSGIMGYAATGIVAAVLGWGTGKFAKKPALGMALMLGDMTYLALKILNDFVPSIAAYSPFGLKGMGMIGPSSFYTPQVNRAGNMGAFQVPSAVTGAIAASMPAQTALRGLGRRGVRVGRMA